MTSRHAFPALTATKNVEKGANIWESNSTFGEYIKDVDGVRVCSHCLCALNVGGMPSAVCSLTTGSIPFNKTKASEGEEGTVQAVKCPNGFPCDALFCSNVCLERATKLPEGDGAGWHVLCCTGHGMKMSSSSRAFQEFCSHTSDSFSLTAIVIARTLDPRSAETLATLIGQSGVCLPWHIVAARSMMDGANIHYDKFLQLQSELAHNCMQAWHLLYAFWSLIDDVNVKLTLQQVDFNIFSQIAALVELRFRAVSTCIGNRLLKVKSEELRVEELVKDSRLQRTQRSEDAGVVFTLSSKPDRVARRSPKARSNRYLIYSQELSRISHSCSPNTQIEIEEGAHRMRAKLLALRHISAGERITTSFVPLSGLVESRQQTLVAQFGISCSCTRCLWETRVGLHLLEQKALSRLCNQYLEEDRFQQAEGLCRFILKKWGGPEPMHVLGQALLGQGRSRAAHKVWELAHTHFPSHRKIVAQAWKDHAHDISNSPTQINQSLRLRLEPVNGNDIWSVSNPVMSASRCSKWIQFAEATAAQYNGWSTTRHSSVPTTDLPIHSIPALLAEWNVLMHATICPLLSYAMPTIKSERIRVHDAFIVKYDAAHGQRFLPLHSDEGDWSLTLALNGTDEYEGGGTLFHAHRVLLRPEVGEMVAFRSSLLHAGAPVSWGTRYIVAAFLFIL